jgi:hypothetical protein
MSDELNWVEFKVYYFIQTCARGCGDVMVGFAKVAYGKHLNARYIYCYCFALA